MKVHNVIIIGSGPAGYTAALYTSRANLNPLLFEGYQSGGQLMTTTDIENFPGYPEGITGPEMMMDLKKQAERFGTECMLQDVDAVDFNQRPFKITSKGEEYFAHAVIVATGATAKYIGLESEQKLLGKGVSACATCDGAFFKGEKLAIVGGGDSAMEEAMFLTRFASSVTVIHRRDSLRASKIMQDRALKNEKIKFAWNTGVIECLGETKLEALKLKDTQTGEERTEEFGGLFVAIGHKPTTDLFKDFLKLDDQGYLITEGKRTNTNVAGVFACGDVQDKIYRQAITAAGSGCSAAIDAERWLEEEGLEANS
jgi:thioredoxin reductase (NADPH)